VFSEKTLQDIDGEVHRIVTEQLERAHHILETHKEQVETLTAALLERETLDAEEFEMLMQGQELPELEILVDHSTGDDEPEVEPEIFDTEEAGEPDPPHDHS
jgi:cell division protease FtsH